MEEMFDTWQWWWMVVALIGSYSLIIRIGLRIWLDDSYWENWRKFVVAVPVVLFAYHLIILKPDDIPGQHAVVIVKEGDGDCRQWQGKVVVSSNDQMVIITIRPDEG